MTRENIIQWTILAVLTTFCAICALQRFGVISL